MRSAGCSAGYNTQSNRVSSICSALPSNTLQSKAIQTIESGWTVPEPGTILLLVPGGLVLLSKRKI